MSETKNLSQCYNRGCGKKFDPDNNNDAEDCVYHPGVPVFHDAYKGWSCCPKKTTDFTEFLNVKGCTKGRHSNEKPPETEKPPEATVQRQPAAPKPVAPPPINRPPFDGPRITMEPSVSPALLEQSKHLTYSLRNESSDGELTIGQSCRNKACSGTYQGPESNNEICKYHPGSPIFHEGLKYWSCCQKKSTDFSAFLAQPGCTEGVHEWRAKSTDNKQINCRLDWHQTGSFVVVSIFAKKYLPSKSSVLMNPVRLTVDLYFVEDNSKYNLDVELRGMVDLENTSVTMLPTKVEVKMKKAYPGTWPELTMRPSADKPETKPETENEEKITQRVDAVDLSDL